MEAAARALPIEASSSSFVPANNRLGLIGSVGEEFVAAPVLRRDGMCTCVGVWMCVSCLQGYTWKFVYLIFFMRSCVYVSVVLLPEF